MKKFPILFCIVLVTAFFLSGCGNPTSYSVLGMSGGSTWPPDKVLADYGIPGLLQPSGASSPQYKDDYYVGELTIKFNGSATTVTYIEKYFSDSGWSSSKTTETNGKTVYTYSNTTKGVTVTFTNDNYSFELDVSKNTITISGSSTQ